MALNAAAKNAMLDHLGTLITYFSLHSVDAPTDFTTELAGGSPAYARKAAVWAAASGGSMSKTAGNPVFDIEGGDTVKSVGFASAVTGGTFYGVADVTDEAFGGQGTYTLTGATLSLT